MTYSMEFTLHSQESTGERSLVYGSKMHSYLTMGNLYGTHN